MSNFIQCPGSRLDYTVNWTDWLEEGDELTASTWSSSPQITFESATFTGVQATAFITGGTAGVTYTVTNSITTTAGRDHCQKFTLVIE